jgi:hypothetical protein
VQGSSASSDAWPISYETVGSSSSTVERRAASMSKLSLIRSLRDQLKGTYQELKTVTQRSMLLSPKLRGLQTPRSSFLKRSKTLGKL